MSNTEPHFFDPFPYAGPVYVLFIFLELWLIRRWRTESRPLRGYARADSWTSVFAGATALIAWIPINIATYVCAYWFWQHRLVDLGAGALGWTVAMIGWDFSFYWQHRAEHEVRLLWAGHATHHSSLYYNFSTALRQSWTPWTGFVFVSWWSFFGVRPEMVLIAGGINLIYQFFLHTEMVRTLPRPIELVFNTPSHHRVHHGSNPQYLDRNHGGMLIIWDRLFGTFAPEGTPVIYGLTRNINSYNPLWVQLHEYVGIARDAWRASRWSDMFSFILRGPGWAPAHHDLSLTAKGVL
jgi:sterol desaturase/sphingolipid hydroxylase (fatty acid hydroxylase superfamily)